MEPGDSFFALSNFVRGKIDGYTLQYSDPMISRVRIDKNNLAQSYVVMDFDDSEKMMKMLNVNDDDIWFARAVDNPYNDFEFIDTYQVQEDFKDGYGVWYVLDEDNKELLLKISKFLYPSDYDLDDSEFKMELGTKLVRYYPDEMDYIFREYAYERNQEMTKDASDNISTDIQDALSKNSLKYISMDRIEAKVGDLISLYYQYNVPHLPLKGLIKEIFENQDYNLGGWDENRWEYGNDKYFDSVSVNREIDRQLNKIYDDLTEDVDEGQLKKYFEFVDRISSKFRLGNWNSLPKDNRFSFRINDFDKNEMKVSLTLRKPTGELKRISITEPNFNNLLYQPELFNLAEI